MRDELERPAGHYAVKRNVEAEDRQRGASIPIRELGLCGRLIWGSESDNDRGTRPCLGAPRRETESTDGQQVSIPQFVAPTTPAAPLGQECIF